MKNNFDLKGYMKQNQVGSYQQLNEMWYQDIQPIGDNFTEAVVIDSLNEEEAVEEQEIEEGKKQLAFVIPCPDCYDIEEEAEYFQHLLDKAGVKAKVKANQVGEEAEVYTKDEKKARKVIEKNGYQIGWNDDIEDNGEGTDGDEDTYNNNSEEKSNNITVIVDYNTDADDIKYVSNILKKAGIVGKVKAGIDSEEVEIKINKADKSKLVKALRNNGLELQEASLEEKGDVKSIGDAGKMAHANTRTNLARHRSSDMLDKMSKKDHKTNTVVGAKAAAYKAPHMKEDKFNSVGDPDLTLNDLNKDIVITPFELEKTWKDVYGEDFKTEYSGAYSYLTKNYKNFTIVDLVDVWERMYGEDFLYEYSGISKWLFSNQGKTSSKDKVAPKMNEDDNIFAGSDTAKWDNYGNETSEWDTEIAGQTIKGWTAEETQGGAIAWQNPRYPNAHIYATPGWEGVDGIALELHDSEDGYMDEPKIQKVVGAGTDLWKTKAGYMALMAKVFTTLEKMLTPSEEMAEDHGTQVDHDKNDNISKDHSEIEDTVNEDEDPFSSIKGGIDKITQGDDEDMSDDDRFNQLGGDKIKAGIESLMGDGFDFREILQFVKDTIASKRNY